MAIAESATTSEARTNAIVANVLTISIHSFFRSNKKTEIAIYMAA
jgi:hypothetical protein